MKNRKHISYPSINTIKNIYLPEVEYHQMNDIPMYLLPDKTSKMVKLELVFPAGRKFETKKALARTTNALLREGGKGISSNDFAEQIDFYGFYLNVQSNLDFATVSLVSLSKYFEKGMELVMNMLFEPNFHESELSKFTHIAAQNLEMQLQKNEFISYREFTRILFGDTHVYGYNTSVEAFGQITKSDLVSFYENQYKEQCQAIILSGDIKPSFLKLLEPLKTSGKVVFDYKGNTPKSPGIHHIKGSKDYQAAVKMGCQLFNRHHKDFIDLFFVNTILGGYFGSRLMKSIRETKGYTYNIYSSLDSLSHDGYFSINCEVNPKHVNATVTEIEKEISFLMDNKVPEDELKMVRNYLLGQMMHMLDGPISSSKLVKSLICDDLDMTFVSRLIQRIQTITAEEIRQISRNYLNTDKFIVSIVGPDA